MFSVIFDMDGTLLDTQRSAIPAWDYAGELQGIKNLGLLIPSVCGMNEAGWTAELLKNYPQIDIVKFKEDTGYYYNDIREIHPMKGMIELLEYLKKCGIKTAVASGSSTKSIKRNIAAVNATEYFNAFVGGEMVENGKPAPDVFLLAAKTLGVNPEDCFVFEDSSNGIIAGYNAGMKCVGIPDIVQFPPEIKKLLTYELNSLDEAIDIFKGL